jgi:hypothetical protein
MCSPCCAFPYVATQPPSFPSWNQQGEVTVVKRSPSLGPPMPGFTVPGRWPNHLRFANLAVLSPDRKHRNCFLPSIVTSRCAETFPCTALPSFHHSSAKQCLCLPAVSHCTSQAQSYNDLSQRVVESALSMDISLPVSA